MITTVAPEAGSRVDKRPGLGIGTGGRGFPEVGAKFDGSVSKGIRLRHLSMAK